MTSTLGSRLELCKSLLFCFFKSSDRDLYSNVLPGCTNGTVGLFFVFFLVRCRVIEQMQFVWSLATRVQLVALKVQCGRWPMAMAYIRNNHNAPYCSTSIEKTCSQILYKLFLWLNQLKHEFLIPCHNRRSLEIIWPVVFCYLMVALLTQLPLNRVQKQSLTPSL